MSAKKKKSPWVEVEVIIPNWGTYKKGDVPKPMLRSTAEACVKHGAVKILRDVKDTPLAKGKEPKGTDKD